MKSVLVVFMFCILTICNGQTRLEIENTLGNIEKSDDITMEKIQNPYWMFIENTYTDEEVAIDYLNRNILKTREIASNTFIEKLLERETVTEYRVRYIYLDGSKKKKDVINALRSEILKQYEAGVPFEELAETYSEDNSSQDGGDLGWFKKGKMVPDFEKAIIAHKKDDIFLAEYVKRRKKWYFVILKTHDERITTINHAVMIKKKD